MKPTLTFLTALLLAPLAALHAAHPKPNILLILADDMGWGDLRCHRNAKINTPSLDKLKTQGVELDHFYVDNQARSAITTVYDPPAIPRPDRIPRWEVPDKVFKPLIIGHITIPAGLHDLQVTAAPGIEIQAVRLKPSK